MAPTPQYAPAVQLPEHTLPVRLGVSPYRPGGQNVQLADPPVLYCPGGHAALVALVDPAVQ